ncbi:hypothetical protein L916_04368 [Phytophthora nicotianae]|uniref:HTH CENPB-type domain-containing protein n=1 Tax=Phytophthora nicotianae TaxID=4792 RepID=W2JGJ5_PHYNI|nr:hypothetical protein L916_04368 [Phytophthora nicotianae]
MLEIQAKETASAYNVSPFMASWHWRKGFMKWHRLGICTQTRQGQKMMELRVEKVFLRVLT